MVVSGLFTSYFIFCHETKTIKAISLIGYYSFKISDSYFGSRIFFLYLTQHLIEGVQRNTFNQVIFILSTGLWFIHTDNGFVVINIYSLKTWRWSESMSLKNKWIYKTSYTTINIYSDIPQKFIYLHHKWTFMMFISMKN